MSHILQISPRVRILALLLPFAGGCAIIEAPSRARIEYWDKHIDQLCAKEFEKDKAFKVYEQDVLPINEHYFYSDGRFKYGLPSNSEKSGYKNPPGVEFVYELDEIKVLNESNPRVSLYATKYIRLRDKKTMSEKYSYIRAGGELIGFGYLSRHICPGGQSHLRALEATFTNHKQIK